MIRNGKFRAKARSVTARNHHNRQSPSRFWRTLGLAVIVVAAACRTGPLAALKPVPRTESPVVALCDSARGGRCHGDVVFTSLGVGGFLIRAGDDAIMTAPFFSRARLTRVAVPIVFRISSDTAVVDAQLHKLLGVRADTELARVRAILVGHSHYDHLLDVPYVMRAYTPTARLVGGMTTKRILMGDPWMRRHADQIDSVALTDAATPWRPGPWVAVSGGHFRIMALRSNHAPNFLKITIAPGHADGDYDHLPRTAWGWKLGDVYAYLVDVLDDSARVRFRVLYQDAAANPMDVLLPPLPAGDARPVDVAIICAGNFEKADDYPTLLNGAVHPRVVIVGHWENFFSPADASLAPIPFTNTETLARRLNLSAPRWFTLEPGTRLRVTY